MTTKTTEFKKRKIGNESRINQTGKNSTTVETDTSL
jgi:hypothetical protein